MILAALSLAWSAVTSATAAWAFLRSVPVASRARAPTRTPILLLRPCAGRERDLAAALQSSRHAGREGVIRFLVAREDDGAWPVARQVAAELASEGLDAQVSVTGAGAPNAKADQLARALAALPVAGATVVVADSDVLLTPDALEALLAPVSAGVAGASWAPPVELHADTLGDAVSRAVLDSSLHAFALLGALDRGGMVGKLLAIRRDVLARVGGFGSLTHVLGEDMELARRLAAEGVAVARSHVPASSLARGRTLRSVLSRYRRWLAVIRGQRASLLVAYPILLAASPLQVTLASAAALLEGPPGLVALAMTLAARTALAFAARSRSRRPLPPELLAPWLADVALLVAFAGALCSRDVRWRGRRLRVVSGGSLQQVPS